MRKRVKICGEEFDIEQGEAGRLNAISVRNPSFYFSGTIEGDVLTIFNADGAILYSVSRDQ